MVLIKNTPIKIIKNTDRRQKERDGQTTHKKHTHTEMDRQRQKEGRQEDGQGSEARITFYSLGKTF